MEQLCDYVHMSASSCCAVCTDQAAQVGKDGWSVELFRRTKLIVLFGLAGHMHLDVAYPAPINLYSCVSAALHRVNRVLRILLSCHNRSRFAEFRCDISDQCHKRAAQPVILFISGTPPHCNT